MTSRRIILNVLALALLVKAVYISLFIGFTSPPDPAATDGLLYNQIAMNILAGKGFSLDGLQPTATKPPGYALFLALTYRLFGTNFAVVRAIQALLLAFITVIIFHIGRYTFGPWPAAVGSLLVAMDPLLAFLAGSFLSEALSIFLTAIGAWALILIAQRPTCLRVLIAGFVWGLAILVRANTLFLVPWLLLWSCMTLKGRKSVWIWLMLVAVMFTLIAPWTLRNYRAFDTWVPLATVGGGTFWGANNPVAQGDWVQRTMRQDLPDHPDLPEVELDRYYYRQGLMWIRDHPFAFIRLLPKKVIRLYHFDSHSVRSEVAGLYQTIGLLSYGIFLPFIGIGFLAELRNRRALLLYCLIGATTTSALVFYGDPRMRSPIQPYLFLFAAVGLERTWTATRALCHRCHGPWPARCHMLIQRATSTVWHSSTSTPRHTESPSNREGSP